MGQALRKVTGGGSKIGPSSKLRGRGEMPMESRFSDDPHFNRHLPGDVHPGPPPPPPSKQHPVLFLLIFQFRLKNICVKNL